jgi:hypothetical protein
MVVDYGSGIIHQNEPTQAVVLNPTIIQPVYKVERNDVKKSQNKRKDFFDTITKEELIDLRETEDINLISKASQHSSAEVRKAVAGNPNTPVNILMKLLQDQDPDIVYWTIFRHAKNPIIVDKAIKLINNDVFGPERDSLIIKILSYNLPFVLFKKLISNGNKFTSSAKTFIEILLKNNYFKTISDEDLQYLMAHIPEIIKTVVGTMDNSNNLLEKLSKSSNPIIRIHVALNGKTPTQILNDLANDPDSRVSNTVKNILGIF